MRTNVPKVPKSFSYDTLDRLSTATASGIWGNLSWTYDGVGNRQSEGTTVYSYTAGTNKLTGAGSTSFSFDNNGNTITQGSRVYTYNQNQRLVQVVDGSMTATYSYNSDGQRVKKNVNGTVTIFHYDQRGLLIAESNGAGAITARYVYLNGQPLAKVEGNQVYYYHNDALGTPQKMTDSTGAVVWAADYNPFGEATITVSTITNNLRFPGQYYDAETGLNYNLNRDYNPLHGRYIESDPIGLKAGLNLYRYANDNPINFSDPDGLKCRFNIKAAIGAGALIVGGSIGYATAECDCVGGKKKTAKYGVLSFGLSVSVHVKGLSDFLPVDFSLDDSFTTNHTSPPSFLSYDQISGPSIAYGYCHGFGNIKANTTETGPNSVEPYPNGPCPKIGISLFEDMGVFLMKTSEKEECCK